MLTCLLPFGALISRVCFGLTISVVAMENNGLGEVNIQKPD